jgi:hypothetical protein
MATDEYRPSLEDLRAIDDKVSLRISKVEQTLIEQSVIITTLSQRAVDSEINLQRLISAVEKLFERADPASVRKGPSLFDLPFQPQPANPPDPVFRPRIVKEDDNKPRRRKPLTRL